MINEHSCHKERTRSNHQVPTYLGGGGGGGGKRKKFEIWLCVCLQTGMSWPPPGGGGVVVLGQPYTLTAFYLGAQTSGIHWTRGSVDPSTGRDAMEMRKISLPANSLVIIPTELFHPPTQRQC